jgi:Insect pheromone-binding family, A10/OS-D
VKILRFSRKFKLILFRHLGSEKQKAGTEKVLRYLIEKKRSQWEELQKKYDPEGVYFSKYEAEAKARGIKA